MTAGIKWVVDHGARVANLSLGDPAMVVMSLTGPSDLTGAINYAWAHGAVPVVAAGNSNALGLGLEGRSYGDMNAIIVGATGPDDRATEYFTSTGHAKWAVVAGGHVPVFVHLSPWTAQPGDYHGFVSGRLGPLT